MRVKVFSYRPRTYATSPAFTLILAIRRVGGVASFVSPGLGCEVGMDQVSVPKCLLRDSRCNKCI